MIARGSRVLDAGCGMGRVGAALQRRGHDVLGVDLDEQLLDQARNTYPELVTMLARLDDLTPESLAAQGHSTTYDLVVCVGNVMILLAPDTERDVLARLRDLLADDGRMLVGFHTTGKPASSRTYSADEFAADAEAVGLVVEQRFGSYDLLPYDGSGDYVVHLLKHANSPEPQRNSWGLPTRSAPAD
ncbi:class I SAM-dependent methyltransferase [Calidifontibacter sp. DB0510]|uniref:Class I SAM-dependent methyltransferase n=2 Tax=Metallococcus carri TaxID=1656884 RepID=A0A967AY53_9MICO|nr:class I SAM-dependent methyltransferase [Metallococcus carri]NOP36569.1 class I SAM-dependent methyltransferase [Calidifontibacter sp. DB2511S]